MALSFLTVKTQKKRAQMNEHALRKKFVFIIIQQKLK